MGGAKRTGGSAKGMPNHLDTAEYMSNTRREGGGKLEDSPPKNSSSTVPAKLYDRPTTLVFPSVTVGWTSLPERRTSGFEIGGSAQEGGILQSKRATRATMGRSDFIVTMTGSHRYTSGSTKSRLEREDMLSGSVLQFVYISHRAKVRSSTTGSMFLST